MAAAGQTSADALTAGETTTQPGVVAIWPTSTQQTRALQSSSAGVPKYVPSTMPYYQHPVFMGPKRVKRGKLQTQIRADTIAT
eukprot:2801900-Pleurochrysis_carterae.AAC.5